MLDAGCGIGWFSARAADIGFEVEGVDFSAEAMDTARRTMGSKVQWHVSEIRLTRQRIPIGDHSRTHVRWRVRQDYLDVLPAWRLAEHHKYVLPAQRVEKDILLFARSNKNGQGD